MNNCQKAKAQKNSPVAFLTFDPDVETKAQTVVPDRMGATGL